MKKPVCYFLAIIIANVLFIKFYFTQDVFRIISFLAVPALLYAIPKLSDLLARMFIKSDFWENQNHSTNAAFSKIAPIGQELLSSVILILLTGFHIYGYWNYFSYRQDDLSDKGIYTPAIVTEKKLEMAEKQDSTYCIYYTYRYNGQVYKHKCQNNAFEVGDTIVVKFAPGNPYHHKIMPMRF